MDSKTDAAGGRLARTRRMAAPTVLAAAMAGTVLLAAACSGGTHSSGTSAPQQTAKAMNVFAQCMRSHGQTDFYYANPQSLNKNSSTPVFGIGGYYVTGVSPQSSQFHSALASCKHLLPPVPSRSVTKQQLDRDVQFAQCMHAHGFPSYPEPDVQNGQLVGKPLPSSIDTSSPQFQAAETACGEG
jgi:hypothetical protein